MLASCTRKSTNPQRSRRHYPQVCTTWRVAPGRHRAEERKIGAVRSVSKPMKLGKRNILDGKKTFRADRRIAELVPCTQQRPAPHMDGEEGMNVELRFEKKFARLKTQNASVSVVDESVSQATTASTVSVRVSTVTILITIALDIAAMSRAEVGRAIAAFTLRSITHITCTILRATSVGWAMVLGAWLRTPLGHGSRGRASVFSLQCYVASRRSLSDHHLWIFGSLARQNSPLSMYFMIIRYFLCSSGLRYYIGLHQTCCSPDVLFVSRQHPARDF